MRSTQIRIFICRIILLSLNTQLFLNLFLLIDVLFVLGAQQEDAFEEN